MNKLLLSSPIFISVNVILSIFLLNISLHINKKNKNCTSKLLLNCNNVIFLLACTMILFSICYLLHNLQFYKKNNKVHNDLVLQSSGYLYNIFLIVIGIILIVLSSIIISESKNTNCKEAKSLGILVLVVSILKVVVLGFYFFKTQKLK